MLADRLSHPQLLAWFREAGADFPEFAPMVRVVEALARKEYAEHIPAGTSLDRLILGGAEGEGRVSVAYLSHIQTFEVRYWPRRGGVETRRCEGHEVERLVDSLALRLLMQRSPGSR